MAFPTSSPARLLVIGYVTAAFATLLVVYGVYDYATSCDPWLTPRWTPYMILWRHVSGLFAFISLFAVLIGLSLAASMRELRRSWFFWLSLSIFFASALFIIRVCVSAP